ncbi:tyrosine-protein phosphatase non-receptor type 14-like [Melanotaenia boesemani]|uniref:tyrosine-protein phosphatase non-receptor type 14-like n=1 Tax=Melanotaenia boesemani TaxID=1250792 RepID=UPI001C057A1B|nr:tyrosine-protein phosphatase non-receptor type 14-like [Melanotaenia boesemani]XP_041831906.1 tyrosine-protein phosphatase non-receptor type 14-like [Melanotaenia boesemani]XP_041831907.1 tyrosine-protein phosphatase non-receptor type 14-like [Melanotaenia boesemani]
MPFRLKLRRTRRYNVLSKNYFVTRIRLLDNNVIECTLSVESTGQECLEAVAQRLELRETHYFGLWFQGKTQAPAQRWVEHEKPLKKQLDKFGNEPLLFFGVMFYVPSVSRLEQEATRYQYYLQVKKEVLDGRLHCTEEQGIRLAGLAVQADFGDFNHYPSQDFLREYVLFPVNWPNGDKALEEWTKKVAEEHKSHCRMQAAEAELLYIKEVERLDGFGQESFPAKDNYTNDIIIGVSFIGVFVKHRNGRSIMLHKWKDIGTIAHNKSAITVEITSRDDTIIFHMEDMEMAKYIARLFTSRHKFYKQNKICAEPTHSPAPIRRRPTWTHRLSLPQPPSCNFQSVHSQYGEHYQDTQSSQDSIFHDDPYYKSETSLDRPVDLTFRNGTVPNGSMYSSPSLSSLNRSQTFIPPSHRSSNLSIPSSEIMRPDYIPSHRHSAIIAPSYRPTPEYDAVMRQKRRMLPAHHDLHSQSLRSLNISNACAYSQPKTLVYSQPEMRERGPYHVPGPSPGPYAQQISYSKPVSHGPHQGGAPSSQGPCLSPCVNGGGGNSGGVGSSISHTVSTPELANTKQQGANMGNYAVTANMLRNHMSRPPPPYPSSSFRPATSTPDLASHRHRCIGGSSPELVTRMVQLSVKTFQPDSSAVVHQSLQEVSEPLTAAAKHRSTLGKRHSMEVISSMRGGGGMEGLVMKSMNAPLHRRNTLREHAMPSQPQTIPQPQPQPQPPPQQPKESIPIQKTSQNAPEASVTPPATVAYQHQKTLSNATMLIHSSESEEEEEEEEERPELDVQIPGLNEDISISAQLQAALAKLPNKPPPEYPGPPRPPADAQIRPHNHNPTPHQNHSQGPHCNQGTIDPNQALKTVQSHGAGMPGVGGGGTLTRGDQSGVNGAVLGPSISEPDLTSVKERVRKEPVKERPVSEMFSLEDSIVEREIAQRTLERQKMSVDSMKRPLMMAALNGLYVGRMPVPESPGGEGTKSTTDERCKTLELKLEEERVFTEYEQVPKKRADCILTSATLPENTERNRFRDVVPYEENRVELVPNKENNTGYINASHIKVMIRGEEWHYIATQGPLANTCADFWQMVWEQGVNVIAMVTAEEEGGRSKSHRYWPKLGSKHNSATHGKFKVTTKFRTDSGCFATTGLKVKHLLSGQERTVWHLQYTDWPEQGCPEYVTGFLSYLEEIQSVRRHTNSMLDTSKSLNPPVVVHCSAGVGRTGVVILTELMISCLEHNEPVEVPTMLSELRQQRMLMVQTISQYKFVYQVLIQFLKNSRLI